MNDYMDQELKKIPKITGIGGVFYRSENPSETREWYAKHFAVDTNEYGAVFKTRLVDHPDHFHQLQWSPFPKDTTYFEPSKQEFMINYTVQCIEELVEQLKKEGVTILDEITTYDYGKFVHVLDVDGNKIELWEPTNYEF